MNFVAYYRVSTEEQGISGLGLSAQKLSVLNHINNSGTLVSEFQDIESGASQTRLGMEQAIQCCIDNEATLVVKELSRITRGGLKYRQLLEENNIPFIESTSPHDSKLLKSIKFSIAEDERDKIRNRTADALNIIKQKIANGEEHISKAGNVVTSLGSPQNLTDYSRERSLEVRQSNARNNENNRKATVLIKALKSSGMSYYRIAKELNEGGFKTSRGKKFTPIQVSRLWERVND